MAEEVNLNPENGNGKLKPPIVVQIILDPNSGQASVNSNIQDKRELINLLVIGIQVVNNSKESNIIVPQSRVKL